MVAVASFWRDGTIGTLCAAGFTLADAELHAATTELCTVAGAAFEQLMRHYCIPRMVSYNYTGESPNPLTLFDFAFPAHLAALI